MDVAEFIRCGVVTGLRQLLEVSICLLLCCAALLCCCAVLRCAVRCCAVQCGAMLRCAVGDMVLAADAQSCTCFQAGQTHCAGLFSPCLCAG